MSILTFNLPEDIRAILKADRAVEIWPYGWVIVGRDGRQLWPEFVEANCEYEALIKVKDLVETKIKSLV
ncbi:MAG: hypothetical protein EBT82_02405 [Micrococcales bacterium]|nr:hypothetical protein [Micrococcales bacterium]NBR54818.1 hypothetical protein [Micrococcales bacterium]